MTDQATDLASCIFDYSVPKVPGYLGASVPWPLGSGAPILDSVFPGFQDSWVPGLLDSLAPGLFIVSCMPGFLRRGVAVIVVP